MQAGEELKHSARTGEPRPGGGRSAAVARHEPTPVIAFERGDLRARPRSHESGASIDFIEVRQGVLPNPPSGETTEYWLTPFQTPAWLEAWQHAIGAPAGIVPVTAIGYSGGHAVFMLPLAVVRRFGASILTWHAYQQSDYTAPLVSKEHVKLFAELDGAAILRQIAQRAGGIDLIYMPKQPETIAGVANPFVLADAVSYHAGAHAINFAAGESWEDFLKRRRSSKTRKRLKEKRSALDKLGTIAFRVAASAAEAAGIIRTCLDAKSEQLAKLGHWDPFSPPGVRDFLVSFFATNCGASTWAVALDVGGKPAATAFGFITGDTWLLYQMAMSGDVLSRHSPGTHLLMDLMQHCTKLGVARLDLALGDESYKAEWCDEDIRLMVSTQAFSVRGKLLRQLVLLRASLRQRMAADAKLYERAKWLKGLARKIRLPF